MRKRSIAEIAASGAAIVSGAVAWPSVVRRLDHRREKSSRRQEPVSVSVGEEERYVQSVDGTRLYTDRTGDDDRVVFFVHGFAENGTFFKYQKPYLRKSYTVVSLDLRGHGRSQLPPDGDFHPGRLAEDIKSVVDSYNPERFVVAGHSLGGMATFKFHELFGERYEGRLKGLIIIDSSGTSSINRRLRWILEGASRMPVESDFTRRIQEIMYNKSIAYLLTRWIAFGKKPPASEVEFLRSMGLSTSLSTVRGASRDSIGNDCSKHLPSIKEPVLLTVGAQDRLTDVDVARDTMELLPNVELKVIEGAGHCLPVEQTGEFNSTVEQFLSDYFQ